MFFTIFLAPVAFVAISLVFRFFWGKNETTLNIEGKYVLITGCDSGFGRETAIRLDKMGARVLATCLTKEGEKSLKSITSDKLETFQMDLTNSQQIEEVFTKIKQLLGGRSDKSKPIHITAGHEGSRDNLTAGTNNDLRTAMWFVIVGATSIALLIAVLWFSWTKSRSVLNVNGKYVLITGCDTGLGRETAIRLDNMGACVLATCLTKEGEQSLRSATSDKLTTYQLDVTNSEQIQEVFYKVKQIIGKSGLWGLVNNAGILGVGPVEWVPLAAFKKVADVNLWGLIDVIKTFLPLVKKAKGRIVLVGSIAGVVSPQTFSPYCITKYGVEAFADSLRREMRPFQVLVSLIEPGTTRTPILNENLLADRLKQMWDSLPVERQWEYGKDYLEAVTKGFRDWVKSGSPHVSHVIDAIVSPLTSQCPSKRYVVGRDAWIFKLSAHLPEVLQDLLVKNFPFKAVVSPDQDLFEESQKNDAAQ